jgi:hypothetical protein
VKQLLEATTRIGLALEEARIPYLVDGSLALYLHILHAKRGFANATRHADVVFDALGVAQVPNILERLGYRYEGVHEGFRVELRSDERSDGIIKMFHCVSSAVANSIRFPSGIKVVPVRAFVEAKLERASLEDKLYVKNLDDARLISAEMEDSFPERLRVKLAEIRRLP